MKIQINSDKQIAVNRELLSSVEAEVKRALERFESQFTRVEIHLSDLNGNKPGIIDKRCLLEVRPAGKQPVSVDQKAATVEQAVKGAVGKMKRLLQNSFGKAAHQTSRASLSAGKRTMRSAGKLQNLRRIEATLSEISNQSSEESPQFERHVRAATDALHKARLLIEANLDKADEPAPPRVAAAERAKVAPKRASRTAAKASVDGRSPKKKGTYRARRKSWPKR
ncbi:MAG: HPF/RaiA family ribosome-associated protein [Acidobacteriota bacterium]|nr:HPF/RaiA family ribosome-associated protein [Acidobacteriota bacterium]